MTKTSLIWLTLAILILIGLFLIFKPKEAVAPTPQTNQANSSATTTIKTFTLAVKNNKLVSGPDSLTVNQGDTVSIIITSDVAGELHLHGYDKAVEFKKDTPATLTIVANLTGRFTYELENTKTEIGALEVLPK